MASTARLEVRPIDTGMVLKDRTYLALKEAIASKNIYAEAEELRLDERQLCEDLGVSRTPVREALARLEQEGFVRTVPRRGVYVIRKTKAEIIEMITVWAALESMAA
ncbi:MAG: GntR family transcriptional regulator, partial [Rhodospirillales bacterium]|nr:GntR family transcriptional regulator [Rhodospirillales bacterium]